jgi:transcription elongation factor GreA
MTTIKTNDVIELTKDGHSDLTAELEELRTVKLPAVIERVALAREHGDLSENSEYHNARDDQQLIETRIEQIEEILSKAVVVKQTKSLMKVGIGSKVRVSREMGKKKVERVFEITGEFEADPTQNKVSSVSPVGKALMSKKKGDTVTVTAPAAIIEYTILEIL